MDSPSPKFRSWARSTLGMLACLAMLYPSLARAQGMSLNPQTTLECQKRHYSYRATNTDLEGRQCWGDISVMACWGRCDSGEIADWRFPYKKSFHPVCMHRKKTRRTVELARCDPGVDPKLRMYQYVEAESCACQRCRSTLASCEYRI